MRHKLLICRCVALMTGVAFTGAIVAQVEEPGGKEAIARAEADKPAAKPASPRKPIEILNCPIELVDEVTLACDRPGIIALVKAREGDTVREGEDVVALQDDVARATLAIAAKEAESDVDIRYAGKAGEVARAELKKAEEANRYIKAIPQVEVDRLKLAAEKTVLELEAARHKQAINVLKRDEAQAQLDTYRVKAPFDGVVTRVHRSKGEAVRQGDQVLELVSTRRVRIEGLVSISDVLSVAAGAEVQVQLDIPDVDLEVEKKAFSGRIVFVDVKAEPVSQRVRVLAEVENPDNVLRAGLTTKMTIFPERK